MFTRSITPLFLTLACISGCVEETEPNPADLRDAAFAPDPFFPEGDQDAGTSIAEDAEIIVTVPLEDGEIRFLDLTPSASEPSVALVVVEPDVATSVLDVVQYQGASPLELFLVVAPSEPVPAELELDHLAHFAERGLSPEPRALDPDVRPRALVEGDNDPNAEDGIWGSGCTNVTGWTSGFNTWSAGGTAGRATTSYLYPNAISGDAYGYFSSYDYVWAAVCKGESGSSITTVQMEHRSGSYTLTSGTQAYLTPGKRYKYYNYTNGAALRRVHVLDTGFPNEFILSGAWKESLPKAP